MSLLAGGPIGNRPGAVWGQVLSRKQLVKVRHFEAGMAYNFAERKDRLRTRIRQLSGELVTYERGGLTIVGIPATIYELGPDELLPYGIALDARRRDYIIDAEEIVDDFGEPQHGDNITDIHGVETVVTPMGEEPIFRYTDHLRRAYRIHSVVTVSPNA